MIDPRPAMLANAEPGLADFNRRLIPGEDRFLGLRMPFLRRLAKEIAKDDWRSFLGSDVNEYHEDVVLWGMVVMYADMDLEERLRYIARFVPRITDWAKCDMFSYRAGPEERERYWDFLQGYLREPSEYGMRFAVVSIIVNYIDDDHVDRVLRILNTLRHPGYYLKMGVAWAVSVCFVRYPERTMAFLRDNDLDDATYNMSLRKITESLRVDDETKKVIRGMRRTCRR